MYECVSIVSYMTTCFAYTCLIWLVASTLQLNLSGPMQIIASTNHGCLSVWANESPLTNSLNMAIEIVDVPMKNGDFPELC